MKDFQVLLFVLLALIAYFWFRNNCTLRCALNTENYNDQTAITCSNDLHPDAAVYGATPWSVVPPSWIGRLDQGNGLIGDDVLSGYSFSPAI